jgi:hypothetical protein
MINYFNLVSLFDFEKKPLLVNKVITSLTVNCTKGNSSKSILIPVISCGILH